MKIGLIGSGAVNQALAKGFLKHHHEVMIASRSADKRGELKHEIGGLMQTGNFEETAAFGHILVLAVKGEAALNVVKGIPAEHLADKTILDATNPIDESSNANGMPEHGVLTYFSDINRSLMEDLQDAVPEAHFVKCFSQVGSALMVNPDFGGNRPTMFICGNADAAKEEARVILDQFGWEVYDMGSVKAARAIEPLAMLWCIRGFAENKWDHAFHLLKPGEG